MTQPAPRLLAVHAHPDDETLSTGGLVATWAAAGWPAMVLTCTRGEQGEVIPAELRHLEDDRVRLGRHRAGEREGALNALGVTESLYLDQTEPVTTITDSGMSWVAPGLAGPAEDAPTSAFVNQDPQQMAQRLAQVIQQWQPTVIVTYEPGGGYGHPDHVRAHQVTMRAVELAQHPVTVLWAVVPQAELLAARAGLATSAHVAALQQTHPDLFLPAFRPDAAPVPVPAMSRLNLTPAQLLTVDLRPVTAAVAAALRCYPTQVYAVSELSDAGEVPLCCALSHHEVMAIGPREYYQVVRADGGQPAHEAFTWPRAQVGNESANCQGPQVG